MRTKIRRRVQPAPPLYNSPIDIPPQELIDIAASLTSLDFTQLTGSIANGQVPVGAVTQHSATLFASPALTGNPTAPTAAPGDNDTSVATTAFVTAADAAALVSPAFTGNPTAPTPTVGDNDTSIATTAFVLANAPVSVARGQTGTAGGTSAGYQVPALTGTASSYVGPVNKIHYEPFVVHKAITISGALVSVNTAAVGKLVRLGIVNAGNSWEPTSLVADFGTVSVGTTGSKTITGLSLTLQPGRYLSVIGSDTVSATLSSATGLDAFHGSQIPGVPYSYDSGFGTGSLAGGFPATFPSYNATNGSAVQYCLLYKLSAM